MQRSILWDGYSNYFPLKDQTIYYQTSNSESNVRSNWYQHSYYWTCVGNARPANSSPFHPSMSQRWAPKKLEDWSISSIWKKMDMLLLSEPITRESLPTIPNYSQASSIVESKRKTFLFWNLKHTIVFAEDRRSKAMILMFLCSPTISYPALWVVLVCAASFLLLCNSWS